MVLEICSGGELFDRIVEVEHYSEAEARIAFSQMVEAVGHCHKLNIVHRDLKPENLLYRGPLPDNTLKLADFGLAQIITPLTHLRTACGTPGYVAPEILQGKDYDKGVDMWSLGVILYILLCGFPPFYEDHTPELFRLIKKGQFDFPSPYWDDIDDSAKDLIKKLLVVDPKKRYSAADVFTHPWMGEEATAQGKEKKLIHFQGNMRRYNAKRKFKGVVQGVMMTNLLKKLMGKAKSADGAATPDEEGPDVLAVAAGEVVHGALHAITTPLPHQGRKVELDAEAAAALGGVPLEETPMSPSRTIAAGAAAPAAETAAAPADKPPAE